MEHILLIVTKKDLGISLGKGSVQKFEKIKEKKKKRKKKKTLKLFNISLFCGAKYIDGQYKFQQMIYYLA